MGRPVNHKEPSKEKLQKLYVNQLKSIRNIARELNLHPDKVHYWLKKYEIQTRGKARKSQLIHIPLEEIERNIKELGIRGYARKLGISEGTVRHHLKVRVNQSKNNA